MSPKGVPREAPPRSELERRHRLFKKAENAAFDAVYDEGRQTAFAQVEWIVYTSEGEQDLISRLARLIRLDEAS